MTHVHNSCDAHKCKLKTLCNNIRNKSDYGKLKTNFFLLIPAAAGGPWM